MKNFLILPILLLSLTRAFGAVSANVEWNVRTDGDDDNGGGFVNGGTGTNYTLQAAAQYSGRDLVIDAVDSTQVSSATHTFVAADVGNTIQIRAGTANLFGNAGAFAATATTLNSLTGDMDLRADLSLTDWSPAADQEVFSKTTSVASGFGLRVAVGGNIQWTYATGAAYVNITSTAVVPFADGTRGWIRAVVDVNNGAAGSDVTFYTSTDHGATWTQLGAVVTTPGVITIPANTGIQTHLGRLAAGTGNSMLGKIYKWQLYSGIGVSPTKVMDVDFTYFQGGTYSMTDWFGGGWSALGTATLTSANGFNSGQFQIMSITAGKAVLDRSAGTTSSSMVATGTKWALGGAFASPGMGSYMIAQYTGTDIWIKSGTYTYQNMVTGGFPRGVLSASSGSTLFQSKAEGYGTVPGDRAARPLLLPVSTATNVTVAGLAAGGVMINIAVDGQSQTGMTGFGVTDHSAAILCEARNCLGSGFSASVAAGHIYGNLATSCATGYLIAGLASNCVARSCTTAGFSLTANAGKAVFCIDDGSAKGFLLNTGVMAMNCVAYGGSSHGFDGLTADSWGKTIINCVAYGRGGYGFSGVNPVHLWINCAGGNNTLGNFAITTAQQGRRVQGFLILTANPFVNAAGHNFALNNVAGGGRSLRSTGLFGVYGETNTTAYFDRGAVQTAAGGGESSYFSAQ